MVTYFKSDLEFMLERIKIAEAHAAETPLFGPGGLIPTYNIARGLRTVDGTYNHLLPCQEQWGAAGGDAEIGGNIPEDGTYDNELPSAGSFGLQP